MWIFSVTSFTAVIIVTLLPLTQFLDCQLETLRFHSILLFLELPSFDLALNHYLLCFYLGPLTFLILMDLLHY
jgi:hypothetical protein